MKKTFFTLLLLCLLFVSFLVSAESPLSFGMSELILSEGESIQPELHSGSEAAESEIRFTSSDPQIASVDSAGMITGLRKGRAVITASVKDGGKSVKAVLNVRVTRKVTAVRVNTGRLSVYQASDDMLAGLLLPSDNAEENNLPVLLLPSGRKFHLSAAVEPEDATERRVMFTSSDPSVFSVDGTDISGVAPGQAVLTAASMENPEISVLYRVLVIRPVSRVFVDAPVREVAVGHQLPLTSRVTPEDATVSAISWSSSDESIATVSQNGTVTGIRRGSVMITATARDGSGAHASRAVRVVRNPEKISFRNTEITINTGKTRQLNAVILPSDVYDRNLTWASSDDTVATVSAQGKVTGIAPGTCEITCVSTVAPDVSGVVTVHVQQLVTSVTLDKTGPIYVGETAQLSWQVEPDNASTKSLKFYSSNNQVLKVSDTGLITPVKAGETYVTAVASDGSEKRARITVTILQHVEGVHMLRRTAYIDRGTTSPTGAILEPKNASNKKMTWESADPSIATVRGDKTRVFITGSSAGETTVTGTTDDGGFQASIRVRVGRWENALKLTDAGVKGTAVHLTVKNVSTLNITRITAEVSVTDASGKPVAVNKKDGGNVFTLVYRKELSHGKKTIDKYWKAEDYLPPDPSVASRYVVRITEFEIDYDWVKLIRTHNQPSMTCIGGK